MRLEQPKEPADIAARVRELRRGMGLSQERLAVLLGVSFASVNRWERGAVQPSRATLDRIGRIEAAVSVGTPVGAALRATRTTMTSATRTRRRPSPMSPPQLVPVPPARLPRPMTSFVGRQQELLHLMPLVGEERLVTLTGLGGSGKTRLAIQIALAGEERFGSRRWWVGLATLSDPRLVAETVAAALDVRELAGEDIAVTLSRFIGTGPALLVLDNAEHLVEAVAVHVAVLQEHCPNLHVLVTSQVLLDLPGERRYPVPALDDQAIHLFAARAAANDPSFELTSANREQVAKLCDRLDGLPLAIELAAAWIPTLGLEEILERLDDRFRLLVGGSAHDLPRHRTMRATVEWSRARLVAEDAHRLDRLGVFVGSFDLAAAEAVVTDGGRSMLATVRDLVSASLLLAESIGDRTRYRLLESVRQFALEKLEEDGELAEAAERHALYYARVAEAAAPNLIGGDQAAAMRRLAFDEGDLRAALAWAGDTTGGFIIDTSARKRVGLRIVASLGRYWYVTGRLTEALDAICRFAAEATADGDVDGDVLRATALYHGAMVAAEAGRYNTARSWGADAERLFDRSGDELGAARAITVQGSAAKYIGDVIRAEERYAAALKIRRRLDDQAGVAVSLNNLGVLSTERGAYVQARERLTESLAIKRELADERGIAVTLMNLGDVAVLDGDLETAERLSNDSFARFEGLGDRRGMGFSTNNLGEVARARGRHQAAAEAFGRSLELFSGVGDQRDVALALLNLGRVRIASGDVAEGLPLVLQSLDIARRLGDGRRTDEALAALALVAGPPRRQGQNPAALRPLTAREREVLRALATGLSNKEAAASLGIGLSTIERHIGHIYRKLGVGGRVEAAAWAIQHGEGPNSY